MFNLLLTLSKSFPFSLLIFDKSGNIVFMNNSAEHFFNHFNIPSISITNFRDFKNYFPKLHSYIENYYTNIFSGNQSKYGIKFSEDYIADITLVPYFENREFKNLSVIIEDKTSHYKKVNAYKTNSNFLKEVIEIKNLSASNSQSLFNKTLELLKNITHQNKILLSFGETNINNNFFYEGFSKKEAEEIVNNQKLLNLIFEEENLTDYKLLQNIYFIPNPLITKHGINLKNKENSMLICAIMKNKNFPFGIIFIEFRENIIPYLSMLEQLELFMQFAPLIFGNYEKTKNLINQTNFIQSIINEIPQSVIVCDSSFNIELFNKQTKNNFNIHKSNTHLSKAVGEELFSSIMHMTLNKEKTSDIEIDGKFFNISLSKIRPGKKVKYIIVLTDITDKVRMERELREKEKLETIKSFCVTANDKINNPLTIISTKLDIMRQYMELGMMDKDKILNIVNSVKKQIDRIATTLTMFDSMDKVELVKYANMENVKQILLENKEDK